ncbi:MAG TPA: 3'-5' exonuclease [Candidatus Obscuribacterales bacterium]
MLYKVYFDYETGGTQAHHPNTQLAAIAVDENYQEVGSFNELIQFDEALADPAALAMNHYDAAVWKERAIPEFEVVQKLAKFLNRYKSVTMRSKKGGTYKVARLSGYKAESFDGPRLKRAFGDEFLPAHPIILDVFQLVQWYCEFFPENLPPSTKLSDMCQFFGIPVDNAHDALSDVRMTAQLERAIRQRWAINSVPPTASSAWSKVQSLVSRVPALIRRGS